MAAPSGQVDALYLEEVARARSMEPAERLLEGPRLFERECRLMADGIRHRHPDLSPDEVLIRIKAMLAQARALEES